jgi:hypothetical protein
MKVFMLMSVNDRRIYGEFIRILLSDSRSIVFKEAELQLSNEISSRLSHTWGSMVQSE